jgi:hypothetical protein
MGEGGGNDNGRTAPMGGPLDKHKLIIRLSETPNLTGADLRVAIQIIDHYNRGKGYAWPSHARIQQKTGLAQSTIEVSVKKLGKIGLFQKAKGRPGQSNRYFIFWSFGLPATSGIPGDIGVDTPAEIGEIPRQTGDYPTYIPEASSVGDGSSSPAVAGSPGGVAGGGGASDFERFWQAYPKREGSLRAREMFAKVVAKGVAPGLLADKAAQYARAKAGIEPRFVKMPANWLRDECWNEDPQPPAPREKADSAATKGRGRKSKGKAAKKPAKREPMADKGRTGRPSRPGAQERDSAMDTGGSAAAESPAFKVGDYVFNEVAGYGRVTGGGRKRIAVFFDRQLDGSIPGRRHIDRPAWSKLRKVSAAEAHANREAADRKAAERDAAKRKAAASANAVAAPPVNGGASASAGKPLAEPARPVPPRPPFKPGDHVGSERTGGGRVLEVNGDRVRVDFIWGIPDDFAFRRAKWLPREVWSQLKQKGSSEADSDWFADLGAGV